MTCAHTHTYWAGIAKGKEPAGRAQVALRGVVCFMLNAAPKADPGLSRRRTDQRELFDGPPRTQGVSRTRRGQMPVVRGAQPLTQRGCYLVHYGGCRPNVESSALGHDER